MALIFLEVQGPRVKELGVMVFNEVTKLGGSDWGQLPAVINLSYHLLGIS